MGEKFSFEVKFYENGKKPAKTIRLNFKPLSNDEYAPTITLHSKGNKTINHLPSGKYKPLRQQLESCCDNPETKDGIEKILNFLVNGLPKLKYLKYLI